MSAVTIYHNPNFGTSRNTLVMIHNAAIESVVIEYLRDPPTRATLKQLISDAGLSIREAIRGKGTPFQELGGAVIRRSLMTNFWMP